MGNKDQKVSNWVLVTLAGFSILIVGGAYLLSFTASAKATANEKTIIRGAETCKNAREVDKADTRTHLMDIKNTLERFEDKFDRYLGVDKPKPPRHGAAAIAADSCYGGLRALDEDSKLGD